MSAPPAPPNALLPNALPNGLRLGELEIRAVLGVGGFGIVYRAFDHALEREVAIKEYMPAAMAARSAATLHVSVLSQGHADTFALGLKSFINEARLLARFDEPSLVKVHRFWEGNGTAYMVMPLYRGRTLKVLRASLSEAPSEAWLRGIALPLLGALEVLHAEGVYHRDIAPDNILVGEDGRPVLLDFGAARRVIGDQSQALTAILKPSYAPIEQYAEATGLRQGPWTDLYALGATLHAAITGSAPRPATARALGTDRDALADTARRGLSVEFLRTIDWMMAPRPEHRPQSVAEVREALAGRAVAPAQAAVAPEPAWERTVVVVPAAPAGPARDILDAVADRQAARPPERRTSAALAQTAVAATVIAAAAWWLAPWEREAAPITSAVSAPPVVASAMPAPAASVPVPAAPEVAAASEVASAPTAAASAPSDAPSATVGAPPASAAEVTMPTVAPASAAAPSPTAVAAAPAPAPRRKPLRPVPVEEPLDAAAVAIVREARSASTAPDAVAEPPAAGASPREQCDGRALLALHRCLKRACEAPAWAHTRECRRVRQIEAAAQRPDN
jgi:Protein kinase domain